MHSLVAGTWSETKNVSRWIFFSNWHMRSRRLRIQKTEDIQDVEAFPDLSLSLWTLESKGRVCGSLVTTRGKVLLANECKFRWSPSSSPPLAMATATNTISEVTTTPRRSPKRLAASCSSSLRTPRMLRMLSSSLSRSLSRSQRTSTNASDPTPFLALPGFESASYPSLSVAQSSEAHSKCSENLESRSHDLTSCY